MMRRRFLNNIRGNDYHAEYFTIEALEDGLTVSLSQNTCEYCIDNEEWITLSADTNTPLVNKGQTLSFKGNLIPNSSHGIGTFTISKRCNLKGNIILMLYGDNFKGQTDLRGYDYAFYKLFYNCKNIVDASKLILPATKLTQYCYAYMFNGCTSLTTAPELPATTLATSCYYYMFRDCKNLTTAPELPATTLATSCYQNMFDGCSNLTTAPELPATTLASYCYRNMFYGCSSLTTAPELPATTLASQCYAYMFSNCTSLTTAPELPATTLSNQCYAHMFNNCSSLTTAPELRATKLAYYCCLAMFASCTSLTTAPELPATTLATSCYDCMFASCTSLTTAPELPATTLTNYCYSQMFRDCTNLNYIKMLATDISASNCLLNWVNRVASSGTFVKHPNMTSLPRGVNGIPTGWTVVNN